MSTIHPEMEDILLLKKIIVKVRRTSYLVNQKTYLERFSKLTMTRLSNVYLDQCILIKTGDGHF